MHAFCSHNTLVNVQIRNVFFREFSSWIILIIRTVILFILATLREEWTITIMRNVMTFAFKTLNLGKKSQKELVAKDAVQLVVLYKDSHYFMNFNSEVRKVWFNKEFFFLTDDAPVQSSNIVTTSKMEQ